jgi:hypothetical protein
MFFTFFSFPITVFAQITYGIYEFTGTSSGDNQFNSVTTQPSYGTFSNLTRTNVTWESATDVFNSKSWNTLSTRDDAEYISFSLSLITPNTFNNISLTLKFDNLRSGTGPTTGEVMFRFGINNFASAGTWTVPTSLANFSFTIPALGNITETFLEIRIHGMSASSAAGTMRFDNVTLEGLTIPLPVELSSFSAIVYGNTVNLKWQTKTEVNNYGFEVERSLTPTPSQREGAFKWEKIGFVNGHGNSNSPRDYSFLDKSVTSGKFTYRLKQIDTDGKYEYSKEVEVDLGLPKNYALGQNYPNPFNPTTEINYKLPVESNVQLQIFTIAGELVKTLVNEKQSAGSYNIDFDASNLASGTYIYRLKANDPSLNSGQGFVQTKKMTLTK